MSGQLVHGGRRVLLTGAFGAVGRTILATLVERGHEVRVFELDTPANRRLARGQPARVEVRFGDLRDPDAVRAAAADVDAVLHVAFIVHPDTERDPATAHAVNVEGTANLLAAAGPRRFVFTSSYHVHPYVPARRPPITVDEPVAPTDHYAAHKIACEAAIRASEARWTILRLSSVMLDRPPDAKNLGIVFQIPLDTRMEMVHPDDAARACANALTTPATEGRTLFVGGGPSCQVTYRELLARSFAARGLPMLPDAAFPTDIPFIGDWLDTRESEALLDFQRTSLADWLATSQTASGPVRLATRAVGPLVRAWMLRYSPTWRARPRVR
jgi:UDP-glucose 4-epimerase